MNTNEPEIRDHVVRVNLTDAEKKLIDAYIALTGKDRATLFRELMLEQARYVLGVK